jgi:DNA (cytosine-5)-methyltransferase 1
VFIIGHLRGKRTRKVFPLQGTNGLVGKDIKRIAHSKYFRRVLQTFDPEGSCEALDTMQGGNRQPCVRIIGNVYPSRNGMNGQVYDSEGLAPTLTTNKGEGPKIAVDDLFRKLTPRECWRLQGFPDWAFDKAAEVNSNSQLYKQAGNSVTVNVIYEIAKRLGGNEE